MSNEQIGYQVSTEDKEDINPEKPTGKRRELLMKNQDREHRKGPDAIQPRRPRLRAAGHTLERLSTRHATLEDVFVALTGRRLRD